jgi:hypothetical protein
MIACENRRAFSRDSLSENKSEIDNRGAFEMRNCLAHLAKLRQCNPQVVVEFRELRNPFHCQVETLYGCWEPAVGRDFPFGSYLTG